MTQEHVHTRMTPFTVRLPIHARVALATLARRQRTTPSACVRNAINEFVENSR